MKLSPCYMAVAVSACEQASIRVVMIRMTLPCSAMPHGRAVACEPSQARTLEARSPGHATARTVAPEHRGRLGLQHPDNPKRTGMYLCCSGLAKPLLEEAFACRWVLWHVNVLRVACCISAAALQHLRSQAVVHLDMKLGNLCCRSGKIHHIQARP